MLQSFQSLPTPVRCGLYLPLLCLNGWLLVLLSSYLQPLPSIIVTASLLAFLLDLPLEFLKRKGINRYLGIVLVLLGAALILTALGLTLVPLLVQQFNELGNLFPQWVESVSLHLQGLNDWVVSEQLNIDWTNLVTQLAQELSSQVKNLSGQALKVVLGTFNSFLTVFLTIVLTVFLLLGGEDICNGILSWLPPWWSHEIRTSLRQKFTVFIGGQVLLGLLLSAVLTSAFLLLNVPLAFLFGFGIGLCSILPFCGAISQTLVSVFLMFQNFWLGLKVFAVALVLGQINDNIVSPRVMGGIVGLNPAWLLVAVLVGFKLGGILGLILIVPIASFIKGTADKLRAKSSGSIIAVSGNGDLEATTPSSTTSPTS